MLNRYPPIDYNLLEEIVQAKETCYIKHDFFKQCIDVYFKTITGFYLKDFYHNKKYITSNDIKEKFVDKIDINLLIEHYKYMNYDKHENKEFIKSILKVIMNGSEKNEIIEFIKQKTKLYHLWNYYAAVMSNHYTKTSNPILKDYLRYIMHKACCISRLSYKKYCRDLYNNYEPCINMDKNNFRFKDSITPHTLIEFKKDTNNIDIDTHNKHIKINTERLLYGLTSIPSRILYMFNITNITGILQNNNKIPEYIFDLFSEREKRFQHMRMTFRLEESLGHPVEYHPYKIILRDKRYYGDNIAEKFYDNMDDMENDIKTILEKPIIATLTVLNFTIFSKNFMYG